MEKEIKKQNQKKLMKKVLIGIGIASAVLIVRHIIRARNTQNVCPNMKKAIEPSLKTAPLEHLETPKVKAENKPKFKDEAVVKKCNKLLKTLWRKGNSENKLYVDDLLYFDIKGCPFPPFITQEVQGEDW